MLPLRLPLLLEEEEETVVCLEALVRSRVPPARLSVAPGFGVLWPLLPRRRWPLLPRRPRHPKATLARIHAPTGRS